MLPDPVLTRRALIASVLMAAAAGAGQAMVPRRRMADMRGDFRLEELIPRSFGPWKVDDQQGQGIVNPQTQELLNKLYNQLVNRVYVDHSGHAIMLAVAYGPDQADDSVQLHYPEVCYPAQGFRVLSNRRDRVDVTGGTIAVRRLETQYLDTRFEPVTYWTIVGDEQSLGGIERKMLEIRHGLKGEIVDGMLVRISSIDRNSAEAFKLQDRFTRDMVAALSARARREIAGLG